VHYAFPGIRAAWLAVGLAASSLPSFAQGALDVGRYVEIVKRFHPAAAERAGLEQAAEAEGRAARVLPDPVFDFSWDRAHPADLPGVKGDETGFALSQTLPWPGTRSAGVTAGDRPRRRPAGGRRSGRLGDRGPGAAGLRAARGGSRPAGGRPRGRRGCALPAATSSRVGRPGRVRASPTGIKVSVEWLRQQAAARRRLARGAGGRGGPACSRSRAAAPAASPEADRPPAVAAARPRGASPHVLPGRTRACARRGRRRRGGRRCPPSPAARASPTSA